MGIWEFCHISISNFSPSFTTQHAQNNIRNCVQHQKSMIIIFLFILSWIVKVALGTGTTWLWVWVWVRVRVWIHGYGYGYKPMGMGTGTGTRPWVRVWVRVRHVSESWVWVWVRVRDHGYGYGYGYAISYPGTGMGMGTGTGTGTTSLSSGTFTIFWLWFSIRCFILLQKCDYFRVKRQLFLQSFIVFHNKIIMIPAIQKAFNRFGHIFDDVLCSGKVSQWWKSHNALIGAWHPNCQGTAWMNSFVNLFPWYWHDNSYEQSNDLKENCFWINM